MDNARLDWPKASHEVDATRSLPFACRFRPRNANESILLLDRLGCVVVAALYGAYSVNKRIFFVQGLPALVAIIAMWWLTRGV